MAICHFASVLSFAHDLFPDALLLRGGGRSGRPWAARIVPVGHAFFEKSIARRTLQPLVVRAEFTGRHFLFCIDGKTRSRRDQHDQSGR
jgi:hypothetical protein